MRRLTFFLVSISIFVISLPVAMANADVERHQFKTSTYLMDTFFNGTHYFHEYVVVTNPCDGSHEATGAFLGAGDEPGEEQFTETVSNWMETATTITFRSDYNPPGDPTYSFEFLGTIDGVDTWIGTASDSVGQNFTDILLTRNSTVFSDHKNHAQYVLENGESPETSCIGMPVVARRDK